MIFSEIVISSSFPNYFLLTWPTLYIRIKTLEMLFANREETRQWNIDSLFRAVNIIGRIRQIYQSNPYNPNRMQKYEIMSAIGEGAYGVVLKCRDVENKITVAIKKFKDTDDQQQTRKTTMREVKILKMLTHPNIVEMKQAFRKKGIVYLVFEYVENNLLEILEKSPNGLQLSTIRKIIYQILRGLAYLHGLNIIHRDIKPENLLVSNSNSLKICDFGFARLNRLEKGEKQMTDYVATRWYRPPELLVGGEYGKEIDIWAVGCIMCQLIDGNPLFPGENQLDQLFLIQKTLGPLIPDHHEKFIKNQRFLGMKFPDIRNLDPLEKKYFGKIDQKGMSFLKSVLKMDASQRMTPTDALNHPFFDIEKHRQSTAEDHTEASFRKDIYTSNTNRKKEAQPIDKNATKYGKIYSKRKTNNQAIAMIYQSSNNCKFYNGQAKSLNKPSNTNKRFVQQEMSLEKHHNKEILRKTEANGFYIDHDEKAEIHYESPRKPSDVVWQSTSQLPFLVTHHMEKKKQKKPQIVIQKQIFHINQIINGK